MFSPVQYCRLIYLEKALYKQIYKCNLGTKGLMRYKLSSYKKDNRAIVLFITNEKDKIVSCGLLFFDDAITKKQKTAWPYLYVYTRKKYRKKGLAKQIVEVAVKISKELYSVYPRYLDSSDSHIFWRVCIGDLLLLPENAVNNFGEIL